MSTTIESDEDNVVTVLVTQESPPPPQFVLQEAPTQVEVQEQAPAGTVVVAGGEQGPPGPASTRSTFVYTQVQPSSMWVIVHNLGYYPEPLVFDSSGWLIADWYPQDLNTTVVLFGAPTSGKAYLN